MEGLTRPHSKTHHAAAVMTRGARRGRACDLWPEPRPGLTCTPTTDSSRARGRCSGERRVFQPVVLGQPGVHLQKDKAGPHLTLYKN